MAFQSSLSTMAHSHLRAHKQILIGRLDRFSDQNALTKALAANIW
jgi:hypothetical protein